MQNNRKAQLAQQKQWRQQWKVLSRKVDENQKTYLKLLATFSQVNPQVGNKVHILISDHDQGVKKSQKEGQQAFGKLKKINESIQQLRETLKYFDKTNQSLIKVQKISEGIFAKMQGMKNQMANSYDQLDELEKKISSDLLLIDRRVDAFDQQQVVEVTVQQNKKLRNKQNLSLQNHNKKILPSKKTQEDADMPKTKLQIIQQRMKNKEIEVEKVDEQIRQMGKFLGWHEQDHKDFLTIWNRNQPNKNYFQIQDEMVEYFKMYTNEQIIDHMNRYVKSKKLNERKKNLINQYKQLKQQKKAEQIVKLKSNQQEKMKKIRQQQQTKKMEQQQKQMKEKVQQWKKQKQQQKIKQKQKSIEEQQRKKQLEMQKRKQEQSKRKQIVEQWRIQQEDKKQKESKQAKRPHSAVNKEVRDRIKQREEQIIRQKMQRAIEKKMMQQQIQKKAQRIKQQKLIKYSHVRPKLDEKTVATKQKEREKFDGKQKKDANTFGGQLLLTGVRAVPEWRQGV